MDTFTKGTISGAFFVYPIDVVKTRLQNQMSYSGAIKCAKIYGIMKDIYVGFIVVLFHK